MDSAPKPPAADRPALSKEQEDAIFRAAGRQVAATVRSQRPDPIGDALAETAAVPVYGAFVSLKRAGQLRSCCGFMGESIPLGEALAQAAIRAAKDDPRFPPIAAGELPHLDMEVWILWGRQPMTARGEDRAHAFTIGKHGLQVARGNCRGLLLPGVAVEHHLDAPGFLRQVCIKAGLAPDAWKLDDTHLMTFEGYAIRGRFPAEADDGEVRPPAVAGTFYPGRPEQVEQMLDEMFAAPLQPEAWAGAMVPHAGWKYSGRLAAAVFNRLNIPPQAIVFCPRHRPGGAQWAVAPHRRWLLPGREVESDPELSARLAAGITGLELDALPHRQEHAIEVQLPLLARAAPQARVVGVTIGGGELASLYQFAAELAAVLRGLPQRPLLVISSDMNHFADDTQTRQIDALALEAMQSLDPSLLYRTVREHRISMCGMLPAVLVMETLRQLGSLTRCELVGYATSAEASGDTHRVVGYAGMLLG